MKEGWKTVKLGEVCTFNKEQGLFSGLKYVGMEHIESGTGIVVGGLNSTEVKSNTFKFYRGDVLYGRLRPYLKKVFVAEHEGCCSTEIFPIKTTLNPYFLKYWFLSEEVTIKINKTCGGCRMPRANMNEVLTFNISFPPLEEQQRIVSILDASFEKIDALKKNAEENLKNAKALFQQVLAQELKPKEGWVEKKITDISENLDYKRVPITKNVRKSGKFPYYGASGIVDYVNDYLYDEDLLLISEDGANLLARTTPIAFSVSGKIWVNNHAHVLRFNNLTLQKFVEYFIAGFNITPYVTGMAQPKLNQKALEKIIISFPTDTEEQHRIVRTLDTLSEKCRRLEQVAQQTIRECNALKQSILRQAFSGEL